MNNQYNVWNKWGKLETVLLGDVYKPEFYKDIKNTKIRDGLLKICEQTLEDLDYFESVLKDFGCEVIRPEIDPNENIMEHLKDGKFKYVPRPPLMPRDKQFVFGDTLVYTNIETTPNIYHALKKYNNKDILNMVSIEKNRYVDGPAFTLVGRDLYIDTEDYSINNSELLALKKINNNVRFNYLHHGGHSDGCFNTIKQGVIVSLNRIQNYNHTFPGWDILYLQEQNWGELNFWRHLKSKNKGKWWIPGEETNDELTYFVESWLNEWVGYVEESVFDVNVLSLDEHHVGVTNINNKEMNAFLKKHKIEPVHIPFRHRYFHDGGLSCVTLELYREGKQEDYFPLRHDQGVVDRGFYNLDKRYKRYYNQF